MDMNDPTIAAKHAQIGNLKRQVAELRALAEAEPNQDQRIGLLTQIRDHMRTILHLEREIGEIIDAWNTNLSKAVFILENRK